MAGKNSSKTLREIIKNPFETGQEVSSYLKSSVADELGKDWEVAMRQMLGIDKTEKSRKADEHVAASGDLQEGQELELTIKSEWVNVEPALNYTDSYRNEVLHFEERGVKQENRELRGKIEEIQSELVKLAKSSSELEVEFKEVSVQSLPENPGKYHLNFFEWVLATIRNARMRIEDSASWVGVVSKKRGKKDYWSLSKQHGTSFSLSGERVVAQQTG